MGDYSWPAFAWREFLLPLMPWLFSDWTGVRTVHQCTVSPRTAIRNIRVQETCRVANPREFSNDWLLPQNS